jgi:hypothetical protein
LGHGIVFAATEDESQAKDKKNKNFAVHNKPPLYGELIKEYFMKTLMF